MKKRRFAQLVLMITMLFCLTFGTVCAQAATTATTTTAKAAVKNGWKKDLLRCISLFCIVCFHQLAIRTTADHRIVAQRTAQTSKQ